MATQVATQTAAASAASTASSSAAASLTQEELDRMAEFDKIVKLSESVTAGRHPRIKVPPHLVRQPSSAPSSRAPAAPTAATSATAPHARSAAAAAAASELAKDGRERDIHRDGREAASSVAVAAFPGLGLAPTTPAALRPSAKGSSSVSGDEFATQRARIEALIREQAERSSKAPAPSSEAPIDLFLDDILQKARALEKTFTPPPRPPTPPPAAVSGQAASTDTAGGGAAWRAGTKAAPSSAGGRNADSPDDQTFYSSKFSTPEYGPAAATRVPGEPEDDNISMHDSSDYEPELDVPPSPLPPQRPQQQPPNGQPPSFARNSEAYAANHDLPSAQQQVGSASYASWEDGSSRLSGPSGSGGGGTQSTGGEHSAAGPLPPSPFVRTHDLSPVAPQPAHISSLAVMAQLPLAVEQQQQQQHQHQQPQQLQQPQQPPSYTYPSAPAPVAQLRREEETSRSSPESSSPAGGSGRATAGKKKGSKKKTGGSKRKAETAAVSPRIKMEPRSPSPIRALSAPRPHKRQRQQDGRAAAAAAATAAGRYGDEYSPTMQPQDLPDSSRGRYATVRRDGRGPAVVYEREVGGERYAAHARHFQDTAHEAYDTVPYSLMPEFVQLPRSWPPPPPPASQVPMRVARGASHALVDSGGSYPVHAVHPRDGGGYPGGYYRPVGRAASVRPDGYGRAVPRSPPPPPPPPPATTGRIIVDEYNREYYEPVRPDPRLAQPPPPMAMAEPEAEELPYDEQQPLPPPPPHGHVRGHGSRYVRGPPPASVAYYDDDRGLLYDYGRAEAPREFAAPPAPAPKRVVTQPEHGYLQYQREYSARPPPSAAAAAAAGEHLVRSATARPPEAVRYEMPAMARYAERVGSVRPPDTTPAYGARVRGGPPPPPPPASNTAWNKYAYMEGSDHPGTGVVREYSVRPEVPAVVPRAYSVRPAPYYGESPPSPAGGGPPDAYYADSNTHQYR